MSAVPSLANIAIVTPVYNDWESLERLLTAISEAPGLNHVRFRIVAVNDSSQQAPTVSFLHRKRPRIQRVDILILVCSIGHQRAIAVGLVAARKIPGVSGVLVMDCDGEDRPEDIGGILAAAEENPGMIICARRRQRSESPLFRACYHLYKGAFRLLTGAHIDFGNFCYIPRREMDSVVHTPMVWNHLAGALVRSRIPLHRIDTKRGQRYAGRSSMNFAALVLHGLSAVSVYADVVMVRLLLATLGISIFAALGMIAVVGIRLFTNLAIPGWASAVMGSLAIVLLQSAVFAAISTFMLLNARSAKPVIPAIDALQYLRQGEHQPGEVRREAAG